MPTGCEQGDLPLPRREELAGRGKWGIAAREEVALSITLEVVSVHALRGDLSGA